MVSTCTELMHRDTHPWTRVSMPSAIVPVINNDANCDLFILGRSGCNIIRVPRITLRSSITLTMGSSGRDPTEREGKQHMYNATVVAKLMIGAQLS